MLFSTASICTCMTFLSPFWLFEAIAAVFPTVVIVPAVEAVRVAAVVGVLIGVIGFVFIFLFEVFFDAILYEVPIGFDDRLSQVLIDADDVIRQFVEILALKRFFPLI